MAETLYKISTVDEEQEEKDDEERLPSVLYQKIPWRADIYTQKWKLSRAAKDTMQIYARLNKGGHGHENTLWIHEKTESWQV